MQKVFALVAVVAAILVVGTACGVAQEDYEAVVAERDSAQAEFQSVEGELQSVKAEFQSVKSELDTMKSITLPKEVIKLSELIPTMGEHWANPATLPVGPIYLVHDEEVIGAEYMFTADLMEEVIITTPEGEETFKHLPGLLVDAYVNHMDIEFMPQGHEGFEVPHFDVHLYFITEEEKATIQPQQQEVAIPQEKMSFRVVVSRSGFNNTQGEFQLEVQKGQEVEITFIYGDNDLSYNNPHVIAISAFGIKTGNLDQENLEATVRFTASDTGEIRFRCTLGMCEGHDNLQGGIIIIQ